MAQDTPAEEPPDMAAEELPDMVADQPLDATVEAPPPEVADAVADAPLAAENRTTFLRRGVLVVAILAAATALGVYLTSRSDASTARDLCTGAGLSAITAAERTGDNTFLVHGTASERPATCRVTRNELTDDWEVAGVG